MTELGCDGQERLPLHSQGRGKGVTEGMGMDSSLDPGSLGLRGPRLVGRSVSVLWNAHTQEGDLAYRAI